MNEKDVPQDQAETLGGQRKPVYAVGEDGQYTTVLSSGWNAEDIVLKQAIDEFEQLTAAARQRVEQGASAALEYHMYRQRMDLSVLAQSTGFFKWQIRRHLKPAKFSGLSTKKKQRYGEALGLSLAELESLPTT